MKRKHAILFYKVVTDHTMERDRRLNLTSRLLDDSPSDDEKASLELGKTMLSEIGEDAKVKYLLETAALKRILKSQEVCPYGERAPKQKREVRAEKHRRATRYTLPRFACNSPCSDLA